MPRRRAGLADFNDPRRPQEAAKGSVDVPLDTFRDPMIPPRDVHVTVACRCRAVCAYSSSNGMRDHGGVVARCSPLHVW